MVFLQLCALSILVLISVIFYERYSRPGRLIRRIPGAKSWPILGNSVSFLLPPDKLFNFLRTLPKKYGELTKLHAVNARGVCIYNPEDIEILMSSVRYGEKKIPYNFLRTWLGEGLLTSNGLKWHRRRKMLTQAFHFTVLKKYYRTIIEQTEEFVKRVEGEVGNTQTDLTPLICSTTLRIMCETAMGTSMQEGIESVTKKYFNAIETVGNCVVKRICRVWLYIDCFFKLSHIGKVQNSALKDLHTFTNKIINERRDYLNDTKIVYEINQLDNEECYGKKGRLAMLDLLIENEKFGNIDTDGIREEVDTFMFEGHDTTSSALTFTIMTIANEPQVQQKLYEEMHEIFGDSDRSPTMEDLNVMKYLECCIKESLRLYPSVPIISRYSKEDIVLSGFTVPANTHCIVFIYDLHRRADLFPEPEQFIPERFLPENCLKRHPYSYIPFSAGPRNCIGQKFAMMEMKALISSLLRYYRVEPITKPSDLTFRADLILRTYKTPVYVRFIKRKNNTNF